MHFCASINKNNLSKFWYHIQSTICKDIYALQIRNQKCKTQAMQNTSNGGVTAPKSSNNAIIC